MDTERIVTELVAQVDSLEDKITELSEFVERMQFAVEALTFSDDDIIDEEWNYDY